MTKEAPRNIRKSTSKPANRRAGETAPAAPVARKPASNRAERAAERRGAIIEAAMEEFIARGFAATRLDDVARRAGVAKGTIYLHFKDKESMFEELIRTAIVPMISRLWGAPPRPGTSVRDMVEGSDELRANLCVAAHLAHVSYAGDRNADGVVTPRYRITLAANLSEEVCRRVNLGYLDMRTFDPRAFRDDPDTLTVDNAGRDLYLVDRDRS